MKKDIYSITFAAVFLVWNAAAAFTSNRIFTIRSSMLMPKSIQSTFNINNNVDITRSMVAMEPERSTGKAEDNKGDKHPTSKPHDEIGMEDDQQINGVGDSRQYMEPVELPAASDQNEEEEDMEDTLEEKKSEPQVETAETLEESHINGTAEIVEDSNANGMKVINDSSDTEAVAAHNVIFRIINRALGPIFGRALQKGVQKNTIKGAWISGALITMMAGLDPVTSSIAGTGFSYLSITQGIGGDVMRAAGEAAWETALIAVRVTKNISKAFGLNFEPAISDTAAENIDSAPLDDHLVDESIARLVEEVENTVAEVESVLEKSNAARDAIAQEDLQVAEAERLAEEARLAEIEYLLEEAKIEKEAREAEEEFLAEEARIAEEEMLAEEARIAEEDQLALLKLRIDEEDQLAEEERLAEMARIDEEERLAEEELKSEEENIAREKLLIDEASAVDLEELADDDSIDDEDWQTSINLAGELSSDISGERGGWKAARQLAKDLADEPEDEDDDDDDEADLASFAEAARAAVEKFEAMRKEEEDQELLEKSRRNEMKIDLTNANVNGLTVESTPAPPTEVDTDTVGDIDADIEQPDFEKMTVVQLKGALRSRGLKVSGRKADLIERLRSS